MVLGWLWCVFEMVLGWFWDGFGMVLGWFWDGFGMVLGWFWGGFTPESLIGVLIVSVRAHGLETEII